MSRGDDAGETMFAVMVLNRIVDVAVCGVTHTIPLTYADGMVGAVPVFATREAAESFSDGHYSVAEIASSPPAA